MTQFYPDFNISPSKPLGNYPISLIEQRFGPDGVSRLKEEARQRGWQAKELHNPAFVYKDVLYVYDPVSLQRLLDKNARVLQEVGWPVAADEFVENSHYHIAPAATPLFDLIADAYSDPYNSLRSNNVTRERLKTMLDANENTTYQWYPSHLMARLKQEWKLQ